MNAYLKWKVQYQKNAWRVEFDSPLTYTRFSISDRVANKGQQLDRFLTEPRLSTHFDFHSFWTLSSTLQYRNRFGDIDDIHYGYLLKTYRTLQRRDVPLQNRQTGTGSISLTYRNPLTAFFGFLSYSYSLTRTNLLYRSRINAQGVLEYSAITMPNTTNFQTVNGQLGKYLSELKANLTTRLSFSSSTSQQLINGSLLTLTNQSLNPGLTLSKSVGKGADLTYTYQLWLYKSRQADYSAQNTSQQKHQLKINLYPSQRSYLGVENEYYANHLNTGFNRNFFTNILFRYTLPKRKIDLETSWLNVWNTKALTTASLTSFSYIESVFELRPMQVVQKVRFSF